MAQPPPGQLLTIEALRALVTQALRRGGFSDINAGPVASTIVASERDGVPSHGLLRLPGFIATDRVVKILHFRQEILP